MVEVEAFIKIIARHVGWDHKSIVSELTRSTHSVDTHQYIIIREAGVVTEAAEVTLSNSMGMPGLDQSTARASQVNLENFPAFSLNLILNSFLNILSCF